MKRGEIVEVARIDSRVAPYDWAFAREEATRIDIHWSEQCRSKPGLFDGRVLLSHQWAVEHDTLVARYFETSYRSFLGWRDFGFPGVPVANCFAMAALRASNGAFMLGEMSAGTANSGRLYFPAGTPDPSDIKSDGAVDLEGSVVRELEEETGLLPADVVLDPRWTIVLDGPAIACMKPVQSKHTVAELQRRLLTSNAVQPEPELSRLVPVTSAADFDPVNMPGFMIRYMSAAFEDL